MCNCFLGDEGTRAKAEDLLEHMVAQRIVVQACLHPQESHLNWGDLMKPLLQGTKAEQLEAKLDQGCPTQQLSEGHRRQRAEADRGRLLATMSRGPCSGHADFG